MQGAGAFEVGDALSGRSGRWRRSAARSEVLHGPGGPTERLKPGSRLPATTGTAVSGRWGPACTGERPAAAGQKQKAADSSRGGPRAAHAAALRRVRDSDAPNALNTGLRPRGTPGWD